MCKYKRNNYKHNILHEIIRNNGQVINLIINKKKIAIIIIICFLFYRRYRKIVSITNNAGNLIIIYNPWINNGKTMQIYTSEKSDERTS